MNSIDKVVDECLGGFAYGVTSVVVAQPFDTVKTRMQMSAQASAVGIAKDLFKVQPATSGSGSKCLSSIPICLNMLGTHAFIVNIPSVRVPAPRWRASAASTAARRR